jgi:predicted  nucleic acid-binding Zn-ribbon protein
MPDANSQDFQAELALLREQVKSQLEAHRLEVAAAIERLAGTRETAIPSDEVDAMRSRMLEWQRRETELSEKITARTVEYQALRARTELDRCRLQMQVADLERQLALRESETSKLKSVLDGLMAEHAECCRRPAAASPDLESIEELKRELDAAKLEAATLRDSMENSVALKVARSLGSILRPVRSLLVRRPAPPGGGS